MVYEAGRGIFSFSWPPPVLFRPAPEFALSGPASLTLRSKLRPHNVPGDGFPPSHMGRELSPPTDRPA